MMFRPPTEKELRKIHEAGLQNWRKGQRGRKPRFRKWFKAKGGWWWTFGFRVVNLRCKDCRKTQYLYHQPVVKVWRATPDGKGQTFSYPMEGLVSTPQPIKDPCRCMVTGLPSGRLLRILVRESTQKGYSRAKTV